MKSVFADTFYFFALLNARDEAHAKAIAFSWQSRATCCRPGWLS